MGILNVLNIKSLTTFRISIILLMLLLSVSGIAGNRYWVAATASNWNNTANWSKNSGGTGGESVPGLIDNAVFNANGSGNCNIDIAVTLDRFGMNGYTGTIDLAGFNMTIAASDTSSMTFSSGTLNDTPGTAQLSITTTGKITFSGTTFGAQVIMSAGYLKFGPSASTFNGTSSFTKTGSNIPFIIGGGCTFNGTTTITNSGTGALYISASDSDIFNDDVTFISTNGPILVATGFDGATFNGNVYVESSSSNIEIGNPAGAGSTLASGKVIAVGGGGFTSGELKLANFTQLGTTAQVITTGGTDTRVYINKGCTWNGNITVTAPHFFVNESTFEGSASLTKSNNATDSYSFGGNTFNGPATIESANSIGNLTISGAYSNTYNDDVTFKTSGSGTGILYVAGPGTEINGNLSIDSPPGSGFVQFFPGSLVIMKGTAAQSINIVGGTPDPIINNLEINNSTGNVTLNTPVTIGASLVLTQGNIITTSINLLTFNDDASVTGASDASFVQGPVKKIGDDAFTFPVGYASNFQPIAIDAPALTTDAFTAEYLRANPDPTYDRNTKDVSIDHISKAEYWTLDRTAGSSNVNVTLAWNNNSGGIDNLSELSVARWDGSSWRDHGNGGTTGDNTAGTIVTSSAVTSFSPFTLASTSMLDNPLPIELLSFSADVFERDKVLLKWQTASETDNDYFTIERSEEGYDWEEISTIVGAGNSNSLLSYQTKDNSPYLGISYYRLKQTDFDGQFAYSQVIAIKIKSLGNSLVSIYPNPATNQITIEGNKKELNGISIYDLQGQEMVKKIEILENNQSKKTLDLSNLNSGIYFIKTKSTTNKLFKQ